MICRLTIVPILLAFTPATALALKLGPPSESVCPLDGQKFRSNGGSESVEENLGSYGSHGRPLDPYRVYGRSLDLRSNGATFSPWPLRQCPSNGFVVYKRAFSAGEVDRLRRYVSTAEYQALKGAHTRYYLAAKLRSHMGEKPADFRYTLLFATWEAGSNWEDAKHYAKYATEALAAFKEALLKPPTNAEEWMRDQLIAGELERRLGRFEDATTRFRALSARKELQEQGLRDVVNAQLHLVGRKDSRYCSLSQPPPGKPAGALPDAQCF
jgi:hypothetical protein